MGSYVSLLWGWNIYINYSKFIMGDLSIIPHYLFIQSFIAVWTHGYLLFTLGYNSILIYLLFCSECSSFAQYWGFFQLAPVSLGHPNLVCVCLLEHFLTVRGSRLFLYVFCPCPRNSHFSLRIPSSFFWRIRNQDLGSRCAYYYWG